MTRALHGRPILIVYGHIDEFMLELQDAFNKTGADTFIARTPADALSLLQRLDFDAIVVNHVAELDDGLGVLVEALCGMPTLAPFRTRAANSFVMSAGGQLPALQHACGQDARAPARQVMVSPPARKAPT